MAESWLKRIGDTAVYGAVAVLIWSALAWDALRQWTAPAALRLDDRHLLTLAAVQAGALLLGGLLLRLRGWRWRRLPLAIHRPSTIAGLLLLPLALLVIQLSAGAMLDAGADARAYLAAGRVDVSLPAALLFAVVDGCVSELFFCGFLFERLRRHGFGFCIALSALLRLLTDVHLGPVAVAADLGLGLLNGAFVWRFRNLWPVMLAHVLLDLIALL